MKQNKGADRSEFDYVTDVLVVGSGTGVLVGSQVVKEQGFEPLVIEKSDKVGGSLAYSSAPSQNGDREEAESE
jgi:ribulose 1,5-bisphosphate synthetase/thiazole synthase